MNRKLADRIIDILSVGGRKRFLVSLLAFLFLLLPIIAVQYQDYLEAKNHYTELILSRAESVAEVATVVLKEKFERIIDVGLSLATRVQFRALIESGNWSDGIKKMESIPDDFSYIDNVAIFDTSGILRGVTPLTPSLQGVIGTDFSYRDYYKGVSKNWQPYISNAFVRGADPKYPIIAAAIPIKSIAVKSADQKVLGFLLLTVKLETFIDWTQNIDLGRGGFVYFVDKAGNVVGNTEFPRDAIANLSDYGPVKKVLAGQDSVGLFYNSSEKEEELDAYDPVIPYGWGVVTEQASADAFLPRDQRIREIIVADCIELLLASVLIYLILSFVRVLSGYRQKEKIFLNSIGDGLVAIDRYWNIMLWNRAATTLTGWTYEEALGKPFRNIVKFIYESDRKENNTFIEKTMLDGTVHFMENRTLLMKKDGKEIQVGDSASPIFDASGRVDGAIIVFRDISKERELEKAKEEFTSLASHQLRTPVTVIKGYASMLLSKSTLAKDDRETAEIILKAAGNMNDLVNGLLNVSRIETGMLAISPEPVYIPDVAEEISKDMAPLVRAKNLDYQKKIAENLPVVSADLNLMKAIVRNLLSNAIKYTPEKGRISLEVKKDDMNFIISVTDTGYGIPKEDQSKVFSKFFRASNVISKVSEGTGLGLYIIKTILEEAGGRIWFVSEEGKGSIFSVAIPLEGMRAKQGIKGLS